MDGVKSSKPLVGPSTPELGGAKAEEPHWSFDRLPYLLANMELPANNCDSVSDSSVIPLQLPTVLFSFACI